MRYGARFQALMAELEDQDWTETIGHTRAKAKGEKIGERELGPIARLLAKYDEYIMHANEEDFYSEGWRPVTVLEFFDNELEGKV